MEFLEDTWPVWAVLAAIGIAIACVFIFWPHALDCPKGQELAVQYYQPIIVGKVVTMTPVFACQAVGA